MTGKWLRFLSTASAPAALWPGPAEFALPEADVSATPLKVLLVVAHPDDESECAGTLYRITHDLGGTVDQLIVTSGEGGRHFSAPAADYYGLPDREAIARELPRLRRKEVRRAGRVLGIRNHFFLDQKDTGFTLDLTEGFRLWDLARIRRQLTALLDRERYDLVLTLLPSENTHGHHQTVAILTLDAIARLEPAKRPAVAGVRTGSSAPGETSEFQEVPGFPSTRTTTASPAWSFDRRTPLAANRALDHSIIVHWVIAEHKSQGMFQMEYGRHTHEHFWQFAVARDKWEPIWESSILPIAAEPRHATAEAA